MLFLVWTDDAFLAPTVKIYPKINYFDVILISYLTLPLG